MIFSTAANAAWLASGFGFLAFDFFFALDFRAFFMGSILPPCADFVKQAGFETIPVPVLCLKRKSEDYRLFSIKFELRRDPCGARATSSIRVHPSPSVAKNEFLRVLPAFVVT
jgi:hypothetical protein